MARKTQREMIFDKIMDEVSREIRKENERKEKSAYYASEEGQAELKRRGLMQEAFNRKNELRENERKELVEFLTKKVDELESKIKVDLQTISVDKIMEKYAEDFAEVDEKSEILLKYDKMKLSTSSFTYFSQLFMRLSHLNPEFIFKAPVKVFGASQKSDTKANMFAFQDLTLDQIEELYNKIVKEDPTLLKNDYFALRYLKYFRKELNNFKSLRDVKFCLTRYPEEYLKLTPSQKIKLNAKDELDSFLSKAPRVVLYMSDKEIEDLVKRYPKLIAAALMKNPEVFDRLDEDFFERHDYRLIFTNYTKAQIKNVAGDKLKRHRHLNKYVNTKVEHRTLCGV